MWRSVCSCFSYFLRCQRLINMLVCPASCFLLFSPFMVGLYYWDFFLELKEEASSYRFHSAKCQQVKNVECNLQQQSCNPIFGILSASYPTLVNSPIAMTGIFPYTMHTMLGLFKYLLDKAGYLCFYKTLSVLSYLCLTPSRTFIKSDFAE